MLDTFPLPSGIGAMIGNDVGWGKVPFAGLGLQC